MSVAKPQSLARFSGIGKGNVDVGRAADSGIEWIERWKKGTA
ncbi:MAG: hypothetical protein ACYSXF_10230 [Planctomycetota bacterium]